MIQTRIQTRAFSMPFLGASANKHSQLAPVPQPSGSRSPLYFDGPMLKTPVAFGGQSVAFSGTKREDLQRQNAFQTALQEAGMLMTVPILLGVSGIAYLASEGRSGLLLTTQNGKRLNLTA